MKKLSFLLGLSIFVWGTQGFSAEEDLNKGGKLDLPSPAFVRFVAGQSVEADTLPDGCPSIRVGPHSLIEYGALLAANKEYSTLTIWGDASHLRKKGGIGAFRRA